MILGGILRGIRPGGSSFIRPGKPHTPCLHGYPDRTLSAGSALPCLGRRRLISRIVRSGLTTPRWSSTGFREKAYAWPEPNRVAHGPGVGEARPVNLARRWGRGPGARPPEGRASFH